MKNLLLSVLCLSSTILVGQNITSITPDNANDGNTLDVTISGAGTNFTQATNTVISFYFDVGTSTVTSPNYFNVDDDENITANLTVPQGTYQGYYGFTVYNDVDGCMANPQSFLVNGPPMPEITNISPNTGAPGNTYTVQLTGVNTNFTQSLNNEVYFMFSQATNTITMASNVAVIDDENLTADITVPQGAYGGDYDVIVYSEYDGYLWYPESFTVNGPQAPAIIGFTPNQGTAGNTYNIIVSGNNTTFTQGFNNATFFTASTNTCSIGGRATSTQSNQLPDKEKYGVTIEPNYINVISDEVMEVNVTFPQDTEIGAVKVDIYNSEQGYIYNPFEFTINGYSLINTHQKSKDLKVYPNPFDDEIKLKVDAEKAQTIEVVILSISGQTISSHEYTVDQGANTLSIQSAQLSSGFYLLDVTYADGSVVSKRLVKK